MRSLLATTIVLALTGSVSAQQPQIVEPPIQSPQDAACREQARAQVFTAPNPNKLSLYDLGSQIYHACMSYYHSKGPNPGKTQAF